MKKQIPNILTLSNLAAGLFAIQAIFREDFQIAAWLLGASLLFDFLDGLTARALKVHSELGLQLDSLADLVSFGVAPGFLWFSTFQHGAAVEPMPSFLPYLAFLIPIFSALRLAKFNIDTRQSEHFIGLPTPANAIALYALALWANYGGDYVQQILLHPFLLTVISLLSPILLVAEIPLLSLKFKDLKWQGNQARVILILLAIVLFVSLRFRAFAFVIPLYLIISLFNNRVNRKNK